jgi:hypothetical protein
MVYICQLGRTELVSKIKETITPKGFNDYGEMAERLNAAVLKTAERDERSVSSNLTLSLP